MMLIPGFLSENEGFAERVAAAGLTWVGPSANVIRQFGLKHTARELAVNSGVIRTYFQNGHELRPGACHPRD
jgi:acetyl/propionyl-CoA carboxylase alpha subunit